MTTFDRAASVNRWRHRPLAEKALIGLGFLALSVSLPPWPGAALSGAVMLAITFLGARVPLRLWLAAAALPLGFLGCGALALAVQLGPDGMALNRAGLHQAALLCLRAAAATSCLLFLALTTPAAALIGGLRRLHLPAEIVEITLLTYRFTFLLAEEARAMAHAQRARLGHASRARWLRSTALLIAALLPRAMARARRLEQGLAARGWQGEMRVLAPTPRASRGVLAAVLALQGATVLVAGWI
ncbi:cobalt ECF transporter T component CbiQ [Maritimibacter alkaliphilus]|uniref:cobalt ECF transporter T component CbiQ n=1 Tax=Maritimibacter alkaliphilus TaxID=404236 RepID=UPI001C93EC6A|nr:cobalt ECF transporter T component CbiQ [Maritimibacter alkaliphilus]MBY6092626.1 cobalt ECF transporter T component CbiQ [Maritimibacter alkaliphilus]